MTSFEEIVPVRAIDRMRADRQQVSPLSTRAGRSDRRYSPANRSIFDLAALPGSILSCDAERPVRDGSLIDRADAPAPPFRRWRGVWLMLSRSSAVIVSLTSLSAGIVLGIILGRGGPVVSAQVAGAARGDRGAAIVTLRRSDRRRTKSKPTTRFTTSWPSNTSSFSRSIGRSSWWPRRSRRRWFTSSRRRPPGPRKTGVPGSSRRPARASSSAATAPPAFTS